MLCRLTSRKVHYSLLLSSNSIMNIKTKLKRAKRIKDFQDGFQVSFPFPSQYITIYYTGTRPARKEEKGS